MLKHASAPSFGIRAPLLERLLFAPLITLLPWLIGQWLRDRWWLSGLCFYIPSPVLCAALLLSAPLLWRKGRRRVAAAALLASLLPALVIVSLENRWGALPVDPTVDPTARAIPSELTLVHWNVFRGWLGWDRVQQRLAEHPADIYVLSELPESLGAQRVAAFGDGFSLIRHSTLGIGCRGFVEGRSERPPSADIGLLYAVCQVGDQHVSILAADLPASPWIARGPRLREVKRWVEHYRPDITVGDFNAPRRSLELSNLSPGYAHAYAVAGRGWSYTWPEPLPVLAIDQCILGPGVRAEHYRIHTSWLSDHRLQSLRFTLAQNRG
ncbi:MAG: endonuclease/exonuclease/phosphatase family protein [Acidobacteriota bacterium]